MSFKKDVAALQKALLNTDQRIKKLEEHKKSASNELQNSKLDKTNDETLRRLERNLDNLHKKRELIIKELKN